MEASHKAIRNENRILSNNADLQKLVYSCAEEYAECDKISAAQNEKRAKIRAKVLDQGIPTDAFLHEYQYYKKKRFDQAGYDDGRALCHEALNKAKNGELWAYMEKPEKETKPKAPDKNAQKPPKAANGKPAPAGAAKPKAAGKGVPGEVLTTTVGAIAGKVVDGANVDKTKGGPVQL